jgi:ribosome-associated toxin RatA of RatAB toxin-antitoxin module
MPYLEDQKILPYALHKVFAVALDLERYPEILSYVKAVKILSQDKRQIVVSLILGLSFIRFKHDCIITFEKNKKIYVKATSSVFEAFHSSCFFENEGDATKIDYKLDAQFKNPLFEWLAAAILPYHAEKTLGAFKRYLDRR